MSGTRGLLDRLSKADGGDGFVICAEGYLFQFERRGYLKAGAFVPEVVLEHPNLVKVLYEEFVHAGSDVVEAFTYYAHREKMRTIGRERDLESINRTSLQLAKQVASETGTIMAGNISNTTLYESGSSRQMQAVYDIFKEQIQWAVEEGADFIIGETFSDLGEARLAIKSIREFGNGLPGVVQLAAHAGSTTLDGVPFPEALRQLEVEGAAVVGLNCSRGPATMLPILKEARKVCEGPLAALPVAYRTSPDHDTWHQLIEPLTGQMAFPVNLEPFQCTRDDMLEFARQCAAVGVQFVGVCCGNSAHYTRAVAEAMGRSPPASRYSADMSQHFIFGDKQRKYNVNKLKKKLFIA